MPDDATSSRPEEEAEEEANEQKQRQVLHDDGRDRQWSGRPVVTQRWLRTLSGWFFGRCIVSNDVECTIYIYIIDIYSCIYIYTYG